MKQIRRWHLFLSAFFAPMLLFFVATGWYQTLNQNRNKSVGEQTDLVSRLTSIHVDSVYPDPKVEAYDPRLFQWLVIAMSICLIVTIALGIYLAFTVGRPKWAVWLSLGLGVLLPVALLWLGHRG
jgi:cyanate permease